MSANLKLRAPVPFPSQVVGSGGIKVSKAAGLWTIQPDFSALGQIAASAVTDPTTKQIWLYDPNTGEYNVLTLGDLGDALYKLTSTTSLAIGTGSKTFTTQQNKDLGVGSWVLAVSDAAPATNFMVGQVTAYSGTSLTVLMTYSQGTGTHTDWTIRVASPPGSTGKSSGYSYAWLTATTSTDPGAGNIKANNASFASITALYISETDADGNALASELATWGMGTSTVKGRLKVYDPLVPANFMTFDVTALTDNGAWDTLTVTPIATGGSFSASEALRVQFVPKGDKGDIGVTGANGVSAGVLWNFASSVTMADPSAGNLRLNNATLASVTAIAVSATDANANSISTWVNTFDDSSTTAHRGTLTIRKVGAPQNFVIFDITGALTDNTTWLQLAGAVLQSGGSFSASDQLSVQFSRTGDAGSGTISGGTAHGVGIATGASSMTSTAVMTNGQLLVGQTGADPLPKTVSGDATMAAGGALTVASIGGVPVGTSGNAIPKLNTQNDWGGGQQSSALQALTDAANIAWDVSTRQKAKVTLGGNRTMNAVTNAVEGTTYWLWVLQDATGSRTLSWTTTGAGSFDFGADGTPTLTTTASKADLFCFEAISIGGTLKLRFCGIKKAFA
jgi:hypothetical protein